MNCCRYGLLFLLGAWVLVSCSPFQPAVMPDAAGNLPGTYALYGEALKPETPWWVSFGSAELNRLIDGALADSLTLKEAWSRLQQARSLALQAGALSYPDLTATGSVETSRHRTDGGSAGSQGEARYTVGLFSTYELDLWGGIHSLREAARMDVNATEADRQTAAMTLTAEVGDRWVQLVSQRLQKALLEKQVANSLIFLELIELRFRNAMVSALDVFQQKQVLAGLRARMPLIEADIQLLMHELALLLGQSSRTDLDLVQMTMPVLGALPPLGLPVDLLADRPDVRAAGMRLTAAEWQLAAARANRLPALRLNAGAQYGRSDLSLLLDTWFLSLAANLTAPLFDAGRRAAEVELRRAQVDEQLWGYRRVVLTAINEVEDALVREARQREHIEGLESVMAAARQGLEEALGRYRRGLSDYLPALTQLILVQDLERDLIRQQEVLVRYRIQLHRALGGGWTDRVDAPVESAATEALG